MCIRCMPLLRISDKTHKKLLGLKYRFVLKNQRKTNEEVIFLALKELETVM